MQASRIVVHPSIPVFKDSQRAFEEAIRSGRLSADPSSPIYAGKYTYMGTWTGRDAFKHIETHKYLESQE
jgi:hypothetical protein